MNDLSASANHGKKIPAQTFFQPSIEESELTSLQLVQPNFAIQPDLHECLYAMVCVPTECELQDIWPSIALRGSIWKQNVVFFII